MPNAPTVTVNPSILTWAREESGYTLDRIARRLQVKDERVEAWEKGEREPTLRQLEQLARFLHRPFSIFFLPRPPQLPPLAADYRRLPGVEPGHESPELRLALRQMLARRENALNLMDELGEPFREFSLNAHLRETATEIGQRLRQAIGISVDTQLGWANEWQAWNAWRAAVEQMGVLVFQFGKISLAEVRGLALLRTPLPVVAVNGKELPEAKSFTLFHEVAHLMLALGHEEAPALREHRSSIEWDNVERFAEAIASHTLVPEDALRGMVGQLGLQSAAWTIEEVRRIARKFRITPLAMATRLRESRFIGWVHYNRWRSEWQSYVASLRPRTSGFATPVSKALNRAGRPFARLVLEALAANRITSVDAARYLDLKFEHFEKLRVRLTEESSGAFSDE